MTSHVPVAAETGNEVRQQGSDGFGQGMERPVFAEWSLKGIER